MLPSFNEWLSETADPVAGLEAELSARYPQASISLFKIARGDGWYVRVQNLSMRRADQGAGTGTSIMEEICRFADEHKVVAALSPGVHDPNWGTTSRGRLVRFYKRFGFVENRGRRADLSYSEAMLRNPK